MIAHSNTRADALHSTSFNRDAASPYRGSARSTSRSVHPHTTAPAAMRRARALLAPGGLLLASVACGTGNLDSTELLGVSSALTEGAEFVSVRKALTDVELDPSVSSSQPPSGGAGPSAADVLGTLDASGDFYIAIKKSSLAQRWFLSAYMKQFYPDFGEGNPGNTLGTRVVSFSTQNDRLYVFDASDQYEFSALSDPTILIEAYPIVHRPEFERLPGASDYVLFDPANGLNEFAIIGNLVSDPILSSRVPLEVGASFMQNFRALPDGAVFEQVFTGDDPSLGTSPPTSVWGTLGVALRHYSVGEGFVPFEDPSVPYYFRSPQRSVPDSGGGIASSAAHWNIYPGMAPIEVLITAGALRAQADYPDLDVLGAFTRGVESWNEVFGFEALRAVQVDDDRVPDDDANVVLVDYPGVGAGFAFADWRTNPNNGEIRGGSVYYDGGFFSFVDDILAAAPAPEQAIATIRPVAPEPALRGLAWGGLGPEEPPCRFPPPARRLVEAASADVDLASLAPAERAARFVQYIVAHEVGHMLGLRHNFKGSLVPPSSSVMDYLDIPTDAILTPTPGAYDRDAIRLLYGLSAELPAQPFCTDGSVLLDPTCVRFDSKAEPLSEWYAPNYAPLVELVVDLNFTVEVLDALALNEILAYARDAEFVDPSLRVAALQLALGPAAVPIASERLENPTALAGANAVAEYVLRRTVLDPPELRGLISFDVTDPTVLATLINQAGRMLASEDGIRSYELRRTTVDVLKRLQVEPALLALRSARDAIRARLEGGGVPTPELPLAEDLLARVDRALAPYFD